MQGIGVDRFFGSLAKFAPLPQDLGEAPAAGRTGIVLDGWGYYAPSEVSQLGD